MINPVTEDITPSGEEVTFFNLDVKASVPKLIQNKLALFKMSLNVEIVQTKESSKKIKRKVSS